MGVSNEGVRFQAQQCSRLDAPIGRNVPARDVLVNDDAFHDETDAPHRCDIFEGIIVKRNDVGFVARCD
jgi:hypothetical protein